MSSPGSEANREPQAPELHGLGGVGHQVHLDAGGRLVVERVVAEGLGLEVAVHRVIDHAQDVAVEVPGDPGRVVVGHLEHLDVLDQIHAEQQSIAAIGQERAQAREQAPALRGVEIADGAAQEQREAPSGGGRHVGQVPLEIADHRVDRERRPALAPDSGGCRHRAPSTPGRCRPPARGGASS